MLGQILPPLLLLSKLSQNLIFGNLQMIPVSLDPPILGQLYHPQSQLLEQPQLRLIIPVMIIPNYDDFFVLVDIAFKIFQGIYFKFSTICLHFIYRSIVWYFNWFKFNYIQFHRRCSICEPKLAKSLAFTGKYYYFGVCLFTFMYLFIFIFNFCRPALQEPLHCINC